MSFKLVIYTLLLLLKASQIEAINNGQFQHWSHRMDYIAKIVAENCSADALEAAGEFGSDLDKRRHGIYTVSCILDHLTELTKQEMSACAVILGVLPIALQMIGPKVSEISRLALRKPVLAFMMSLGSPCATVDRDRTGLTNTHEEREPLWPEFLKRDNSWLCALIWVLEYGIVGVAAGNSIYLGYQLTYTTVTLISSYLGTYGNTLEAFSQLLWVFCSIPIHAMGVIVLQWYRKPTTRKKPRSIRLQTFLFFRNWIIAELTPIKLLKKQHRSRRNPNRRSYWPLILNWLIKLCVWVQTIYGVFIFSSTLFISLWDALRFTSRFLCGSLACRWVLAFELYGAQRVAGYKWPPPPTALPPNTSTPNTSTPNTSTPNTSLPDTSPTTTSPPTMSPPNTHPPGTTQATTRHA